MQFCFSDQLRRDASSVVATFQSLSKDVILLSGDRDHFVQSTAVKTGIKTAYGDLTPLQKYDHLQSIKASGHTVLMVGDGLNDAPVLAGADVSMAPGTAIDMAQNAADIVFMGDGLTPVMTAYSLARKTQMIIRENFMIAILYNMVAIPVAFMGLVTPMIAAMAMSGSSILVIANSFRLKLRS